MTPTVDWSRVTAVFGGRFDPVHWGHLEAILGVLARPGVADVLALPSGSPAYKPCSAPPEARQAALAAALAEDLSPAARARVHLDDRECRRPGPTYSWDTLQELRAEGRAGRLAFVLGIDQFADLPRWHRFPEVLGLCHWIVLERRGGDPRGEATTLFAELESAARLRGTTMIRVPTPARECSSTSIREAVARTGRFPDTVSPAAARSLMSQRIYGSAKENDRHEPA